MKKALLNLAMICSLPMSSIHAGWRDWLPTLSSWQISVPSGIFPIPNEASQLYKNDVQPVIDTISAIKTEEKRQNLINSAKKYGLYTAALISTSFLTHKSLKGDQSSNNDDALQVVINILSTFLKIQLHGASFIGALACASKAGYDTLQSLRFEKGNLAELNQQYKDKLATVIANHANYQSAFDRTHVSHLLAVCLLNK